MAKFDAKAYGKNILRSAGYIATETIKGVNPTLTSYISETKSDAKEMYDSVKEFRRNPKGMISDILEGAGFKEVEKAKNNILDDIRTGKFYNPEREKSTLDNYMKTEMGFDFNFDDLDLDVDENFGEDDDSSSSKESTAINNLSRTQQKLTAASTDEIVKGYTKGSKANIANNTKMFGVVNNSLSVINSSILNLHQDLATPLNNHIINSSNFYQTATSELAKQTAYLQHIDSLITGRFENKSTGFNSSNSKLDNWNSIMSGGLPNIKKLFGNAKKKVWEDTGMDFLGDLFSPDMIQMFSQAGMLDSPIAMALSMIAGSKLQNSSTGKAINRFSDTLQNGSISLFSRIHNYNKKSMHRTWNQKTGKYEYKSSGALGWLANIFDIFPDVKGGAKIDRSKYRPFDRAEWTNKDSRALELIPDMLSNIYSALSGTEPQVYDYKSGTWKNKRSIKKDFENDRLNSIKSATFSFNNNLLNQFVDNANKNADSSMPMMSTSSRAARAFSHDYELILKELTLSKIDISSIDKSTIEKMCRGLAKRGIINSANVNTIVNTIYNNPANKAAIQTAVLQARIADNKFIENSASSTYARSTNGNALYNGKTLSDGLVKVVDDKGNNMFFYLQKYYTDLEEIKDILSYGRGYSTVNKYNNRSGRKYNKNYNKEFNSNKDYFVPNNTTNKFYSRGAFSETAETIDINDISSRDLYSSTDKKYIAAKELSKATNKTEVKNEEKQSPLAKGIDKITDFLSNLFIGTENKDEKVKKEGILKYIDEIPEKIVNGISEKFNELVNKAKGFFASLWDKAVQSAGGKSFGQNIKDMVVGFGKDVYSHAKEKATGLANWFKGNYDNWAGRTANPSGSYRGGQVTKSGMVSVSEGEMIIPSEYNPFYTGRTSKSHQKATEAMNYRNWLAGGAKGGEYWGSFSKGSKKVKREKLDDKDINKVKRLYNAGFDAKQIAKKIQKPIKLVERAIAEFNVSSDVQETAEAAKNTARDTFNKVKNSDLGKKAEDLGSKLANGIDKSMTNLFGKHWGETKDNSKIAIDTIKKNLPQTAAAGTIGALIGGAATGSGLGLLGGFVLGSGIMTLKNSKELNEKLFGTADEKGNYSGGKLPKEVATFIKSRLPGIAKSGALGTALGAIGIAPGGMLGGFVLGAGLDLLSHNEKVKNSITQLLFGNEDINGKRSGGILGSLKVRVVDPLSNYVQDGMDKVTKYITTEILSPLQKAASALSDWVMGKGTKFLTKAGKVIVEGAKGVYHNLDAMFDGSIGKLLTTAGKLGDKAIKTGANVIKAPFALLGKGADALAQHNVARGYSSKSAKERVKTSNGKTSQYNKTLAGMMIDDKNYTAEGENFIRQVDWFSNGFNKNKAELNDSEMKVADTVIASLNNGGMGDPKTRGQLSKLFRNVNKKGDLDYSSVSDFIKNLDDSKMSAANRTAVLKYIQEKSGELQKSKDKLKNYDQEQLKFFKDNQDKLGNMLTIDKDGKVVINQKALSSTALQARLDARKLSGLSDETLKKSIENNASKAAKEAKLKEAATVDPLGEQRNTILEDIFNLLKKFFNKEDIKDTNKSESNTVESPLSNNDKNKVKDLYKQGLSSPEIAQKLHLNVENVNTEIGNQIVTDEVNTAEAGRKAWEDKSIFGKAKNRLIGLGQAGYNKFTSSKFGAGAISLYSAIGADLNPMVQPLAKSAGNALDKAKKGAKSLLTPFTEEHDEGETKTDTVDGHVLTFVWRNRKWNPDMTDSDTNKYFTNQDKDNTLKNKFFGMFTSGSLLEGIKDIFLGEKDKDGKRHSLLDKLKEGAAGLFTKFFGADGFIGKAVSGLLNGGLGTLLKTAFEGLVSSGALTTILAGAGIAIGANALAKKDAGTKYDSGMRSDIDSEERKNEVKKTGILGNTAIGLRNLENRLSKKNMLAYSSDDFVSSYAVDRTLQNAGFNILAGAAGNGALGKAAAAMASGTIGKIPVVGKALATPLTLTGKLGSALGSNGSNLFKNAASKLTRSEKFLDTMANSGKLGERILDTVDDIGTNGLVKTVSNTKVGQSIATAAKKFSETKGGKVAVGIADSIKAKIQPIFKIVLEKLGVENAANEASEVSGQAGQAIAATGGGKLGALLSKLGSIVYVARIALAIEDGLESARAKVILGIIDTPTIPQRLFAATLNAINYAIPGIGGIIPTQTLFNIFYTIFEKFGIDLGGIKEERAAAQQTLAEYRIATKNPGATLEEYIHNELGEYTTQERVKKAVGDGVKAIGNGVKTVGKTAINGIKTVGKTIINTPKNIAIAAGNLKTAAVEKVSSGFNAVKTGASNLLNGAKSAFNDIKDKAISMKDIIAKSKETLTPFRDAGDLEGLLKADSDTKSDGTIFGVIPMMSDAIFKRMYIVPTALNFIGGKVGDLFDTAKKAIPDFGKMIKSLWAYTDTKKDMGSYDSTVKSFKVSKSGPFSKIGNALVSGIGSMLKFVINGVRIFGAIGDKVSSITNGAGNIKDNIINGIKNLWSKFTGSGSGIHVSQTGSNRKFGASNLDKNGCGPASAATILRAYGKNANLNDTASYAEANGYVAGSSGVGTRASYFGDVLGANGISTAYTSSKNGIKNAVKSGHPTVLLGQDSSNRSKSKSPFGPNPHYVVARGSDARGNVIIDDPELKGTALYDKSILDKTKLGIMTGGDSGVSDTSAVSTSSSTPASVKDATWAYFRNKGLTEQSVAGIMGNLDYESGHTWDPKITEYLFGKRLKANNPYTSFGVDPSSHDTLNNTYTAAIDSKKISLDEFKHPYKTSTGELHQYGYGLPQFTSPGLKENLYNHTVAQGKSISDTFGQLDALSEQLQDKSNSGNAWGTFLDPNTSVSKAMDTMLRKYERPKDPSASVNERLGTANKIYQEYTGKSFDLNGYKDSTGSVATTVPTSFPKYNLDDKEIAGLANIIQHEQPGYEGRYAEASLMANLTDMKGDEKATKENLIRKAVGGWFYDGKTRYNDGYAGKVQIEESALKAANDVFKDGKRTVPRYIDEHDCFSDIASISPSGTIKDRSIYKPHETTIHNKMGSTYKFYTFPNDKSDPFGYTSDENRTKWGEGHYTVDANGNIASNDLGTMSSTSGATSGSSSGSTNGSSSSSGNSTFNLSSFLSNVFSNVFNKAISTVGGAGGKLLGFIFGGNNSSNSDGSTSSNDGSTASSGTAASTATAGSLAANSAIKTTEAGDNTPQYGGIAKPTPSGFGTPESMVKIAQSQLGVVEGGANNQGNITDYGKFMGMNGEPWCASFVSWVMDKTFNGDKEKRNAALRGAPSAAVSGLWDNFKSANAMTMDPQPGDVVIYKNGSSHTGLVETVNGKTVTTIEGNTSAGEGTFDRNGGVVARHRFTIGDGSSSANKLTGFGRPNWPTTSIQNTTDQTSDLTASGSGLNLIDFTKKDRFKSYKGGDSELGTSTIVDNTPGYVKPVTSSNSPSNKPTTYEDKFDKVIEKLESIVTNTGYAAAIPQIIELLGQLSKITATVNSNSGANTDTTNMIDTEISSMMAKLDAIATSI